MIFTAVILSQSKGKAAQRFKTENIVFNQIHTPFGNISK